MLLMYTRHSRLGKSAGLNCKDERRAGREAHQLPGLGLVQLLAVRPGRDQWRAPLQENQWSSWHQSRSIWQCRILSMMLFRMPIAGVVSDPGALQGQARQPMGRLQALQQGPRLGRLEQGWALGWRWHSLAAGTGS